MGSWHLDYSGPQAVLNEDNRERGTSHTGKKKEGRKEGKENDNKVSEPSSVKFWYIKELVLCVCVCVILCVSVLLFFPWGIFDIVDCRVHNKQSCAVANT